MRPLTLIALTALTACRSGSAGNTAAEKLSFDDARTSAYERLPDGAVLDGPLEVLFAPDDPTITLELALIDEVRQARATDNKSYSAADNPYRITYAVHNLRNEQVITSLDAAHDEGVFVQILIEARQLDDEERWWNTVDEVLCDGRRDWTCADDHRNLDEDALAETGLIGISGDGAMHLATRLFETKKSRRVLSGSLNPGDNAVYNDETLHLINDADVVDRFATMIDSVLYDEPVANVWDDRAAVNVLFTPEDTALSCRDQILDWIGAEDEQVLLSVYALRNLTSEFGPSLLDLLTRKVTDGVPVYAITDKSQSDGSGDTFDDDLRRAGVHLYEVDNDATDYTVMHHKAAILGLTDIKVVSGTASWTDSALGSADAPPDSYESCLFIDSAALDDGRTGRRYLAQWMGLLGKYADQGAGDEEDGFWDVATKLMSQGAWPFEAVTFQGNDIYTDGDEGAWVLGDLQELGAWGQTSTGIALSTTEQTYPTWHTPQSLSLPVGTPFQWKLVAGSEDELRWEEGDNRSNVAGPPVLIPDGELVCEGTWR